jgi:hypothetical protein
VAHWSTTPLSTNESYFSEGERVVELCKKEGLEMLMQQFAMDLMVAYTLVADTPNCRKYAQLALDITKVMAPPGHVDIGRMGEYLEDPRKAAGAGWGTRLPMPKGTVNV